MIILGFPNLLCVEPSPLALLPLLRIFYISPPPPSSGFWSPFLSTASLFFFLSSTLPLALSHSTVVSVNIAIMVGNREEYWVPENYDNMSAGRYLATRFSSLKPPMLNLPNPWKLLRMLNRQQWAFFAIAFWAWTWDAFDFFTVSLTVADLAKQFDKQTTDITWGITLVLMFRSVGAILFGVAADRYGRKWPFIVNNLLFIALELVR